jgi:hypothetical protein
VVKKIKPKSWKASLSKEGRCPSVNRRLKIKPKSWKASLSKEGRCPSVNRGILWKSKEEREPLVGALQDFNLKKFQQRRQKTEGTSFLPNSA